MSKDGASGKDAYDREEGEIGILEVDAVGGDHFHERGVQVGN